MATPSYSGRAAKASDMTDPIRLAAEARPVIQELHRRNDVVVIFKTDKSIHKEDKTDELDRTAPGHFRVDQKRLTLNLDTLISEGKPMPESLREIADFRAYPVLAGVAAHESAHARYSLWDVDDLGDEFPETIPNPDYDPDHAIKMIANPDFNPADLDADGKPVEPEQIADPLYAGPEEFPVVKEGPNSGELYSLAKTLEEPRVERLGIKTFSKTWREAMRHSASHLILESVGEMDSSGTDALDSAVRLAILIGGRNVAGTLGFDQKSRTTVNKVLDSAQAIIETALSMNPDAVADPYHKIMGIISKSTMNNDHTDPIPHLEAARQIQNIIHPERQEDPDSGGDESGEGEDEGEGQSSAAPGMGPGEGGADGDEDGDEGTGSEGGLNPALQATVNALESEMEEALAELIGQMQEEVHIAEDQPEQAQGSNGKGAVVYDNPKAPQLDRYEDPSAADRDLYRAAQRWMESLIQPTVTESERGQWLPGGGARLNVRSFIRDNAIGLKGPDRTDWDRVSETVKPAPPVRVGLALDGSGSMNSRARETAGIAWAAANAAADLPESRVASVVYGAEATVTQKPGHNAPRKVAVSRTDGPWENFISASKLLEEALWLDEQNFEEFEGPTNTLIIVVSDLAYKADQGLAFSKKSKEWTERGFRVLVVGSDTTYAHQRRTEGAMFEDVTVAELFK